MNGIMSEDTNESPDLPDGMDQRNGERRRGPDRRKQELGPPDGVERRKGERRRLPDEDSGDESRSDA